VPAVRIGRERPEEPEEGVVGYSNRGFAIYGEVPTTYGDTVRIYESSSAEGPFIWLSIDKPEKGIEHAAAHLSLEQALEIRDALKAAIRRGMRLYGITAEEIQRPGPSAPDSAAPVDETDPEDGHAT
jgi:hypothetical protein